MAVLHQSFSLPASSSPTCSSVNHRRRLHDSTTALQAPPTIDYSSIQVPRRNALSLMLSSSLVFLQGGSNAAAAAALQPLSVGLREYIDSFDGYSFKYPKNWIQVRGAGADIFFRDPYVLDENLSMDISSPSSSNYKSIQDLGSPRVAGDKLLKQYVREFMSTRLGVRREPTILTASSRVADDGNLYYQVEVNIKSYANNNELAVMPQDRVARLEWDRRYLSVLAVENKQLYELRLQTPENVFLEEEADLRQVMDSFRVFKATTEFEITPDSIATKLQPEYVLALTPEKQDEFETEGPICICGQTWHFDESANVVAFIP